MSGEGMTINFEEEIEHFKPSLESGGGRRGDREE